MMGSPPQNLLESALGGAIASVQSDGVTVMISYDLYLEVAGILTELHEEDETSDDLVLHLNVGIAQVILVVNKTDSLSSTSLRGMIPISHPILSAASTASSTFWQVAISKVSSGMVPSLVSLACRGPSSGPP